MIMNCKKIINKTYEYDGSMPLFTQFCIWLHSVFCSECAKKIERFYSARFIMQKDFFPPSPGFENSIMAMVEAENELPSTEESYAAPGCLSTRGWVIAGLIILVSLVTAFFGLEYQQLADEAGVSFLLPMGITIGIVLTVYGAFFIGSRLKELSQRFGL